MIEILLGQLSSPYTGEELFDQLPDTVYFIKNQRREYVLVNRTLVTRCGASGKSELIGKTVSQVIRAPISKQFEAQDARVIETGQPVLSHLELHLYSSRDVGWCLTTKIPLRGRRGESIGLVGVSQDLRLPDESTDAYRQLAEALTHAEERISNPPTVGELAEKAGMSRFMFERRMQAVYSLTAKQWLLKLRISAAEQMLRFTEESIANVAFAVGYTDQSAFTRQFSLTTGLTPRVFRAAHKMQRS